MNILKKVSMFLSPHNIYKMQPPDRSGSVFYRASPKYMVRSPTLDPNGTAITQVYPETSRSLLRNPLEYTASGKLIDIRIEDDNINGHYVPGPFAYMDKDYNINDQYVPGHRTYSIEDGHLTDRYPVKLPDSSKNMVERYKNEGPKSSTGNNMYVIVIVFLILYIFFDKMHK